MTVSGWSTPGTIRDRVRRRWDTGELLTCYGRGDPFPVVDLPLHGPRVSEIGPELERVRSWIEELRRGARTAAGPCYEILDKQVGGRELGRNTVPARAVVADYEQAWRLLGVTHQVRRYDSVLAQVAGHPPAREWVLRRPLAALELHEEWPRLLAAYDWLVAHRGSGAYLREVSAPGVDTKLIERHRGLLAELLGAERRADRFAPSLGYRDRPATVRLRFEPGFLGMPDHLSDATLRVEELADARVSVRSAVIVENEITFLSVPVPSEGVVLFGEGFRVARVGSLRWLRDARVHYWGDLDTHGFAILNQLRAWLPQAESLLMDEETLLAHRDRWVREPSPTSAALDRLTGEEQVVYRDLVSDHHDEHVRLEQERVDWEWAMARWPEE